MSESTTRATGDGVFGAVQRGVRRVTGRVPADLVTVVAFVVVAGSSLAVGAFPQLVRAALGIPLLFLVPGYVTVAAAFPRARSASPNRTGALGQIREISGIERAALSFGLSFALLPLLGLAIAVSPWQFGTTTHVAAVGCYALAVATVATWRRHRVPSADRYRWRVSDAVASARTAVTGKSGLETGLNLLVIVGLVAATGAVGYALAAPQDGEQFSTVSVLTETETGERVAGNYPTDLDTTGDRPLVTAVENHEGERTRYELVVAVERIDTSGEPLRVTERVVLHRAVETVPDGGTWYYRHDLRPVLEGGNLRVSYLLYEGEAPATPTPANASQHAYFWVSSDRGTA